MNFLTRFVNALNYLSTSTIIVQVHQTPRVLLDLASIQKSPRILHSESNVGRASSPLPSQWLVAHRLMLLLALLMLMLMLHHCGRLTCVATAQRNVAFGTCGCDGMNGSGTGYRIGEGRLTGTYRKRKRVQFSVEKRQEFLIHYCYHLYFGRVLAIRVNNVPSSATTLTTEAHI